MEKTVCTGRRHALTGAGQLEIVSVSPISTEDISPDDAVRAGFESRDALLAELHQRPEGTLYRIELGALRDDPRTALRESLARDPKEIQKLKARLARLDSGPKGPWTLRVLDLIRQKPRVRAGDLRTVFGYEKELFKICVRKLKNLGLTESLEVGYRLSPRRSAAR